MLDLHECQKCEDVSLIEPFIKKADHFLRTEFNISVQSMSAQQMQNNVSLNNINFLTNLSGAVNTNLIFSFEKPLAKTILDSYEYITYTDETFDELLFEVVAEFLNLVVGRAMADIPSEERLRFSPPIEIIGNSKLFCNEECNICKIDVTTLQGNMTIIFSTQKDEG